jgi:predicted O-linked N-acetylglucosamine transferase (SPINDLY family)
MSAGLFAPAAQRAMTQNLDMMELIATAEQLQRGGETNLALELYKTWLAHNSADLSRHVAYFNYGVALSDAGDFAGAKAAFLEAINLNKDFLPPYVNLGVVEERMGAVDLAVSRWYHVVNVLKAVTPNNISYKLTALKRLAKALETAQFYTNAEEALRLSLEIDSRQRELVEHWLWLRQGQCKWPVMEPWGTVDKQSLTESINPLSLAAYCDDPLFQLGNACHHNEADVGRPALFTAGVWPTPEAARTRPLRIGYLSSDLRAHAVGFLTTELLELHDRKKVEIFVYYCGISADDSIKTRIKAGVDHWVDIAALNEKQAAKQVISDGIDILVDLNGYSKDARTKLLALRPAPIIVNWLGYPGTMGSPYHHYIVADDYIIPPGFEIYYSEKVMRLPCYQPNDRKREISDARLSRRDVGLPDDAMVYCCFNGSHKVTRFVFEAWMKIIAQVPSSVLWFLAAGSDTQERLQQRAEQYGIARDRLIFADRKPNYDHLPRFPLADVFLDTLPYGAHTTASDAMWMGLPVLTVSGRSFASRVCGSLVRAAGLGELVCNSFDEYVARAIEFGRDRSKLNGYRERLVAERDKCVLFDTPALARHLEALYESMWDDYSAGRLPQPDLTNLALYREIGREQDQDMVGFLSLTDYHARYRQALAYRNSFAPFPLDRRLWTSGR